MKAKTTFSLKDQLFNQEKIDFLADQFGAAEPNFKRDAFVAAVMAELPALELKARIVMIAEKLHLFLPADYPAALEIILRALPPELDPTKTDDDFGDFIIAPLSEYVAMYGAGAEHLDRSLAGLREITKRFSCEGPIRTFINAFPERTIPFLEACAAADNYHVRRLASEGTRPKLPWAQKLVIDHTVPLNILNRLFADPTRYVTRSVANHLNDIAKIEPALVIQLLTDWQASQKQAPKEMKFVTQHSLRTLVKKGDMAALTLLGFGNKPEIGIENLATSTPVVQVGEPFLFSFDLVSHAAQNLLIDYEMIFAPAGPDKKPGKKMFKLKQAELKEGERLSVRKKHPMRLMTTRQLYSGRHTIELQINGEPYGTLAFELVV